MQDVSTDVRHALRGVRKSPAFALVAVLSLALAIGANGFVFGVLDAVVRPLQVSDPQSLYQIRYGPRMSGSNLTTSYPALQDIRRRNTTSWEAPSARGASSKRPRTSPPPTLSC
jgi:hypothetical protein